MSREDFAGVKALRDAKREIRMVHGINCPVCIAKTPKRIPSRLLPQQTCKVDGYKDERPRLPRAELDAIFEKHGLRRE